MRLEVFDRIQPDLEYSYFRFCIIFILIIDDLEDTHLLRILLLRLLISIIPIFLSIKGLNGGFVRCVLYNLSWWGKDPLYHYQVELEASTECSSYSAFLSRLVGIGCLSATLSKDVG
jgi:hypothetical protein